MAAGFRKLRIAACFLAPLLASALPLSVTTADAAESSASLWSSVVSYAAFVTRLPADLQSQSSGSRAVIQVESAGNAQAVSPRGALLLMQIMPESWVELSVRYDLGLDPFDPHDNVLAGAAYLREMLDRFGSEGCLAAYNARPQRYEEHLAMGRPLPGVTEAYVAKLGSLTKIEHGERSRSVLKRALPWQNAPMFVDQFGSVSNDDQSASVARLVAGCECVCTGASRDRPLRAAIKRGAVPMSVIAFRRKFS